jgi:hypothetical protein
MPPAMSLAIGDDTGITAIRGPDFLRLGEYTAQDKTS